MVCEMTRTSKTAQLAVIGGLLLVWCVAASAQDIKYNYLQGTDFSKYETYKCPDTQRPIPEFNSRRSDQTRHRSPTGSEGIIEN
jgi:hypothetical protein